MRRNPLGGAREAELRRDRQLLARRLSVDLLGSKGFFAGYEPECQDCANQACLDEMAGCVADRECEATVHRAIGDPDTIDPPGTLGFSQALSDRPEFALKECAFNACAEPCGLDGTNLHCLSGYAWPEPQQTDAMIEFFVQVYSPTLDLEPLPEAAVDFCGNPPTGVLRRSSPRPRTQAERSPPLSRSPR